MMYFLKLFFYICLITVSLQSYTSTNDHEKKSEFSSDLKWVVVGATGATALILLYNKLASSTFMQQQKRKRLFATTDHFFSKFGEKKQHINSTFSGAIENFTSNKQDEKIIPADVVLVLTTGVCASLFAKYFSPPVLEEEKTTIGTRFFSIPNRWLLFVFCSICYCTLRFATNPFSF